MTVTDSDKTPSSASAAHRQDNADRLRCLILLGGALRNRDLIIATGRPLLKLPLTGSISLIDHWQQMAQGVVEELKIERLPIRLLYDQSTKNVAASRRDETCPIDVEWDPLDLRGTAGVLHDVCKAYQDDDLILIANANQVLFESLASLTSRMLQKVGAGCVLRGPDGSAAGLTLLPASAFRGVPDVGFVDLKEQLLPTFAADSSVSVLHCDQQVSRPIQSRADYIRALREYHLLATGHQNVGSPFTETWDSVFCLVEDGADVAPTALVHDAIVLRGARVETDALVARSVICPGAVVGTGRRVVDRLLRSGRSADQG